MSFMVHDGRDFRPIIVTEDMVGHKFGEFVCRVSDILIK